MASEIIPTNPQEFILSGENSAGEEINEQHRAARTCVDTAVDHAVRCGELLIEQKGRLQHGEFQPWIEANCAFSYKQAARYMQVHHKSLTHETFDFKSINEALGYDKSDTLATKHTGDEESYTPMKYIESARLVMGGIDLDPASNDMAQETVKADVYFTVDDDGLEQDWSGNVWMNPPYTALVINQFIEKVVAGYSAGDINQAVVLTNNNTDTSWFHLGVAIASATCFTKGRINFDKRDGTTSSPTNGQSFFYFGDNVDGFKKEFSKHGFVMVAA